jgi:hypothetical protein
MAFPAAYGTITRYGSAFQTDSARKNLFPAIEGSLVLQPRGDKSPRFGLIRVRSPLLTESLLLSLPGANEMFQFAPLASYAYVFSVR